MLFDLFGPLLGPLLIVIMVIVVFESCWRKCPPDKLMIVSGFGRTRSVSGKGTFVILGLCRIALLKDQGNVLFFVSPDMFEVCLQAEPFPSTTYRWFLVSHLFCCNERNRCFRNPCYTILTFLWSYRLRPWGSVK